MLFVFFYFLSIEGCCPLKAKALLYILFYCSTISFLLLVHMLCRRSAVGARRSAVGGFYTQYLSRDPLASPAFYPRLQDSPRESFPRLEYLSLLALRHKIFLLRLHVSYPWS